MELAYIPSPSSGVLYLGPVPLRGYAFSILAGLFVALWIVDRRWVARGGRKGTAWDIAFWAVPFGLVGGRLYHVITDYQLYFGEGRNPVDAFKIWEGGLGIWGAVALGAVGAWIGCRRRGIALPPYADALAPGLVLAQGIGRWGNWFNQELYGRETDLPWALHITSTDGGRVPGYYHPTFLYESLWCVGVALLVIWADRRFKLGHGRVFALYVAAYCAGRFWIEYMRVDEAHQVLGLRLNNWTALIVFVLAVVYFVVSAKLRPGRETVVEPGAADGFAGGDEAHPVGKGAKAGSLEAEQEKEEAGPKKPDTGSKADTGPKEDDGDGAPAEGGAGPGDAKTEDAKTEDAKTEDAKTEDAGAQTARTDSGDGEPADTASGSAESGDARPRDGAGSAKKS
ncbi:prolipoprotein diacylglyceryl transferase [Streptomyces sp. NEAU-W12]|uniref:prolipoprotein diacylglyceryl transferase n=1 Tax=Streptomyces sp. NEAU-W12 TaxID=2994668 RepID=UPI00224AC986|nr:prolipoprotein diacylglyceryl transferase [Streptomyces sp. NEAU-W12]MCX2922605.1 prolipoprotein diacylglyceryl transferase [Streptomyces sp. NEAU-W12]